MLEVLSDMRFVSFFFFFSSRRRHTRLQGDWSSDVCSSDLPGLVEELVELCLVLVRHLAANVGDAIFQVRGVDLLPGDRGPYRPQQGVRQLEIGRASCRERV